MVWCPFYIFSICWIPKIKRTPQNNICARFLNSAQWLVVIVIQNCTQCIRQHIDFRSGIFSTVKWAVYVLGNDWLSVRYQDTECFIADVLLVVHWKLSLVIWIQIHSFWKYQLLNLGHFVQLSMYWWINRITFYVVTEVPPACIYFGYQFMFCRVSDFGRFPF